MYIGASLKDVNAVVYAFVGLSSNSLYGGPIRNDSGRSRFQICWAALS
jgi:hypothetical protein